MSKVLKPEASYTFSSYFEMQYNVADILANLGFSYDRRRLELPVSDRAFSVTRLQETLDRNLLEWLMQNHHRRFDRSVTMNSL